MHVFWNSNKLYVFEYQSIGTNARHRAWFYIGLTAISCISYSYITVLWVHIVRSYNDHFTVCTLVVATSSVFNDIFCSGTNLNDCPLHQWLHFFSTADPTYVLCTLMFENEIIVTCIYVYEVENFTILFPMNTVTSSIRDHAAM